MIAFVFVRVLVEPAAVFVLVCSGGRDVMRAKKFISALIRGQGRVPLRPMPSFVVAVAGPRVGVGIGVVATMRVRGGERGGILFFLLFLLVWFGLSVPVWVVEVPRWIEMKETVEYRVRVLINLINQYGVLSRYGHAGYLLQFNDNKEKDQEIHVYIPIISILSKITIP